MTRVGARLGSGLIVILLTGCPTALLPPDNRVYAITDVHLEYLPSEEVAVVSFEARWRPRHGSPQPTDCSITLMGGRGAVHPIGGTDLRVQTTQDTVTTRISGIRFEPDDVVVDCESPLPRATQSDAGWIGF